MSTTTDLDDFFNKRLNKKKKNAGKKFDKINTEEFARHLEANAAAAAAKDLTALNFDTTVNREFGDAQGQQTGSNVNNDEDWTPFESEENKDYSGLRVNILQNWKDENENEEEVQQDDETEKQPNCPWSKIKQKVVPLHLDNENDADEPTPKETVESKNISESVKQAANGESSKPAEATGSRYIPPHLRAQQQQQQPQQPQQAAAPPPVPAAASSGGSKYVPPHLRNSTNTQSSYDSAPVSRQMDYQTSSNRKYNKNQPNINDVSEFPSLGDFTGPIANTQSGEDSKNENQFEQPKRGGKVDARGTTSKIDLENKFDALSF